MKKVALVTGAGSGIGRHTAWALNAAGFQVVLTGRRREPLEETAARNPAELIVAPADVSDQPSVGKLFETIERSCGRLDVLFNNAGMNVPETPTDELSLEQWKAVIDTNLTGVFLCVQNAIQLMKRQDPMGGRIINNGSVSAQSPRPHSIAYTATKHAVTGMTKSVALDGRRYNIACGQIDIGNALTDMAARMQEGVRQATVRLLVSR